MDKIRVGVVSYLNTKPLLYGIERSPIMGQIELIKNFPAAIATLLVEDQIDLGLVPVAVIPRLKTSYIITDYCIGAENAVASVCLFSDVPIEEITTVMLDYQSNTSVKLFSILMGEYWQKEVHTQPAQEGYELQIKGTTAGVVIGDRAFLQRAKSKYVYDLAEIWKRHTGLPFVFAAWIANKKLPDNFISAFNLANGFGLDNLETVITEEKPYPFYDLSEYYHHNISYKLTEEKRAGLALFLEKIEN